MPGKSAAERAALRRLNTILNDPEYGAPLVRLPKGAQARVLKLVDEGKGRQARKLITELDTERRHRERLTRQARAQAQRTGEPAPAAVKGQPNWWAAAADMGAISAKRRPEKRFKPADYVDAAERHGGLRSWEKYVALRGSKEAMIEEARWAQKSNNSYSVFGTTIGELQVR